MTTDTAPKRRPRVQLPHSAKAVLHGAAAMISAARGYLARAQTIVADLAEGNVVGAAEAGAEPAGERQGDQHGDVEHDLKHAVASHGKISGLSIATVRYTSSAAETDAPSM